MGGYGTYRGPNKLDKGQEDGSCNRTSCQCSGARWYNHGSRKWYCEVCANDIGQDGFNLRDWEANYQPQLGHPMFETRSMMNRRAGTNPKGIPEPASTDNERKQ
jgi:hypothetical protein